MKIVYIVPGFGEIFYCQNCIRNIDLAERLTSKGFEIKLAPMYLPLKLDLPQDVNTPVFYGALNVYLRELLPFLRHIPEWIQGLLNSKKVLNMIARRGGSTDPVGYENMTISVMKGEKGRQGEELEKIVHWLKYKEKPDAVHFSNAMLIGMSKRIKEELDIPVFCTLQDENTWIDRMRHPFIEQAWDVLTERSEFVDLFISVSRSYKELILSKTGIPDKKIKVVHIGIPVEKYETVGPSFNPPVIGYLSRISKELGFDILVDAFIELKKDKFKDLKLRVTGGSAPSDKKFIKEQLKKLDLHNFKQSVEFVPYYNSHDLKKFFKGLSLVSVPVPEGEAFGIFQIESMLSGIPVVQPELGGFPEVVKETGGGVVYKPNNSEQLAKEIAGLLTNQLRIVSLGETGSKAVYNKFSIDIMVDRLIDIYRNTI